MRYLNWFKDGQPNATTVQNLRDGENFIMPDGTVVPNNGTETFGFWLPHGLGGTDNATFIAQIQQCKERFNKIEEAFREVEGIPRENLWLESEQAEVFEQHPEPLTGDAALPKTRNRIVLTGTGVSGLWTRKKCTVGLIRVQSDIQ